MLDIKVADKSERWVYVKADVDEVDGSASQGDKVIELIFDTSSLENQLASLASNQILITISFVIVGGIVSQGTCENMHIGELQIKNIFWKLASSLHNLRSH